MTALHLRLFCKATIILKRYNEKGASKTALKTQKSLSVHLICFLSRRDLQYVKQRNVELDNVKAICSKSEAILAKKKKRENHSNMDKKQANSGYT